MDTGCGKTLTDNGGNKVDDDGAKGNTNNEELDEFKLPKKAPSLTGWTNGTLRDIEYYFTFWIKWGALYWKQYKSNNSIENRWGEDNGITGSTAKNVTKIMYLLDCNNLLDNDSKYGKHLKINDVLLYEWHVNATTMFKVV